MASCIALSSCTVPDGVRYQVFDKEVCGDLGSAGAHCNHTLTNTPRDVTKDQWDRDRIGMLCMSSEAFNDTETVLEQLCTNTQLCDYETRSQIRTAIAHLNDIIARAKLAKKISK